jgi:hypothetical protein
MRAPEGSDSQVNEDGHYNDHGVALEGLLYEICPVLPETENEQCREQKKKETCDLKPDDAANTPERLQEARDATADATPGLSGPMRGGLGRSLAFAGRVRRVSNRLRRLRMGGRGRSGDHLLAGDASHHAHPYSQSASNHARSHPVYDGSSGVCRFLQPRAELLSIRNGCKVERFHTATHD